MKIIYWIARFLAAIIMAQTLFFKFTGSQESIEIFSTIHMEPWGRFGVGILELIASVLLIINRTAWMGALLALGLMGGAIMMHLTILGIEVQNDGGQLFIYALIVAVSATYVLYANKDTVHQTIKQVLKK
jgi:uncharacterized membrane protein YphA (DoxX/SURF4 family)